MPASPPFWKNMPFVPKGPAVPVLRLDGIIGSAGRFRQGMTLSTLAGPIERAFSIKTAPAVALVINSPGGSPTQSDLIFRRIRALAEEKEKRVIAFAEDVAASGGYWLAMAADEIYAMETSMIGSIGAVMAGFGFPGLIEKIGVDRRLYTAGEHKARLDAFRPESSDDREKIDDLLGQLHGIFKTLVKERRGERLKATQKKAFSGDVWLGGEAKKMGLIDGLGDTRTILREKYGEDVRLKVITPGENWLKRRLGMDSRRSDWPESIIEALEGRALWARYGL